VALDLKDDYFVCFTTMKQELIDELSEMELFMKKERLEQERFEELKNEKRIRKRHF